jgi:hypothetical protein
MKTRLFFARAMALALVAGGIAAGLPTEAMAAKPKASAASVSPPARPPSHRIAHLQQASLTGGLVDCDLDAEAQA